MIRLTLLVKIITVKERASKNNNNASYWIGKEKYCIFEISRSGYAKLK